MARKPPRSDFSFNADSLLAEMPTVSYICENDEFYTMRYISSSILLTLGYQADEFIDNAKVFAASVAHPEDLETIDAFAESLLSTRQTMTARVRLVRRDGTVFPCLLVSRAICHPKTGEAVAFSGTVVDISGEPGLQGPTGILTKPKQTG